MQPNGAPRFCRAGKEKRTKRNPSMQHRDRERRKMPTPDGILGSFVSQVCVANVLFRFVSFRLVLCCASLDTGQVVVVYRIVLCFALLRRMLPQFANRSATTRRTTESPAQPNNPGSSPYRLIARALLSEYTHREREREREKEPQSELK